MDRTDTSKTYIILIKQKVYWEWICQKNQAQMNKNNIRKIRIILYCNHKFGYKIMPNNKIEYKYETPLYGVSYLYSILLLGIIL